MRDETRRLAEALRREVRSAGLSQREIERRLEWTKGYLSQVLNGNVGFRLDHLFDVLEAIGRDPAGFFAEALPVSDASKDAVIERFMRFVDQTALEAAVTPIVEKVMKRTKGEGDLG